MSPAILNRNDIDGGVSGDNRSAWRNIIDNVLLA